MSMTTSPRATIALGTIQIYMLIYLMGAIEKEDKWRNPNEGFHFDRLNEIKVVDGKLHWTLSVKPGSRRVNALTDYDERGWFRYSGIVEVNVNEIFPMIQKIAKLTNKIFLISQQKKILKN